MRKFKMVSKLILSGLLPVLVFLLVFMGEKVTQGTNTLLVSDLNGQYVNFFLYFKEAVKNGENLFYSFSMLLGGDTVSLLGYYLLSPLNFLLLIWPSSKIASCIFVIIAIKIGLTGITSYLYFTRKRGAQVASLIFSTTYALAGYWFAYFMNVMWLDALYLLPLVIMGLEVLVEKKKILFYILALTASIVICYYTGYMTAGFCLLYFVYLQIKGNYTVKECLNNFWRFAWTSILAALLSAIVLVPVLLSQIGNRQAQAGIEYGILHSIPEVLSRFFTGAYSGEQFHTGAPHIYCGMLILFFTVLLFMLVKKSSVKSVIAAGVLIVPIMASFLIGALDIVWHGMATPNSFTHRYAFVFVFALVILAEEVFSRKGNPISIFRIALTDVLLIGLAVWIWIADFEWVKEELLLFDVVSVILISIFFFVYQKQKGTLKYVLVILLLLLQTAQLFINGKEYVSIHTYDDHSSEGYYSTVKPFVEEIQKTDNGLYRIEKMYFNSANDSMMLSYNGVSHFSSADKSYIRSFMGKLGYNKNFDFWVYYGKGATKAADSLLGIKYILSTQPLAGLVEKQRIGNQIVYENPYALEWGTLCSAQVNTLKLDENMVFSNQEAIYSAMLGEKTDIFTYYEEPELVLSNIVKGESEGFYVKEQSDLDGVLSFTFTAKNENPVYMYLPSVYNPGVDVVVNGEPKGEYLTAYSRGIMELGIFSAGETVDVELRLQGTHAGFSNIQICAVDEARLGEYAARLKQRGWTVLEHTNNRIKAKVVAEQENEVLLLTIPYNENWRVEVDGKQIATSQVADALMAIDVRKGAHIIDMKYQPKGLTASASISAVALLVLICIIIKEKKTTIEEDVTESIAESVEEIMEEMMETVAEEATEEVVEAAAEEATEKSWDEPDENDDLWEFRA